jgi:hypothetical protein
MKNSLFLPLKSLGIRNRTRQRKAILILPVTGFRRRGWEKVVGPGVESVVAQEFEGRSVERVGPGFGRHIYSPHFPAEFRRIDPLCTLNSCSASTDGRTMYRLKSMSVLVTPSSV